MKVLISDVEHPVTRRTRVMVVGQTPPPPSGMHVVVGWALDHLRKEDAVDVAHLPARFSARMEDLHRPALGKLAEVIRVIVRLLAVRSRGPVDVALYPVGGPSFSSTVRDILLLPAIVVCSRRTVLHFHGAGHDRAWIDRRWWMRAASRVYRRCDRALVMTPYNRRDPESLGIRDVVVLPHRLTDSAPGATVANGTPPGDGPTRFLYLGHLGDQRRTTELVAAFGLAAAADPEIELHLVGRPVPPYGDADLDQAIAACGAADRIVVDPVLLGDDKWKAFEAASWFVFPSVFECESFGLVLAEALMFGLPVVVTDWRGNLDVVDVTCDREIVDPDIDGFVPRLADALIRAAERRSNGLGRSESNRRRYLDCYADLDAWGLRAALTEGWEPARR